MRRLEMKLFPRNFNKVSSQNLTKINEDEDNFD